MSKPARKLVSRKELNDILTRELQAIDDLGDARLHVKYALVEPDETGCNWSTDFHLNAGSKGSIEYAAPIAHRIV